MDIRADLNKTSIHRQIHAFFNYPVWVHITFTKRDVISSKCAPALRRLRRSETSSLNF